MLLPEERVIFRSPPEMLPWVVGQVLDFAVGLLLLWIIAVSDSSTGEVYSDCGSTSTTAVSPSRRMVRAAAASSADA